MKRENEKSLNANRIGEEDANRNKSYYFYVYIFEREAKGEKWRLKRNKRGSLSQLAGYAI